jgi:hypothetical protein
MNLRAACGFFLAGFVAGSPPAWVEAAGSGFIEVGALVAAPTTPQDFMDSWGVGWGIEGAVGRRFGGRWALALEGRFQQFRFEGDVPGREVSGGARRFGHVGLRLDAELWRKRAARENDLRASIGGGYAHQSIEPISGTVPLPSGPADGVSWNVGLAYSLVVYQQTRVLLGVRHTWTDLPSETVGDFALRLGATVPLGASAR